VASKLLTRPIQRHPLFLAGVKIPMVSTHKFFGIILVQELQWKDHVNYALQKDAGWVTQYQWLEKLSKGISPEYMWCFYIAVAVPKMLYAVDLFLVPESHKGKGTKGFINRLGKIQRQACLHITGTLRSAPTDIIDACADLLPFHLLVEKLIYWAATRLMMLPQAHPCRDK